jgi:hypothetical protein
LNLCAFILRNSGKAASLNFSACLLQLGKNMIVVHTFGPAFGQPDASPFVTKVMLLLKFSRLPYRTTRGNLFTLQGAEEETPRHRGRR